MMTPHSSRPMMTIALLSLLSACTMMPQNSAQEAGADTAAQNANGTTTVAKIIPAHQEITPASSIEKNQLSVSYSLKSIPGKHEDLLRLTLIFKNQSDKNKRIWPHITLIDGQGNHVSAYSLKTLRRITSHQEAGGKADPHNADQWADMFWIKSNYRIPAHGIAIGELVYHSQQLHFPMQLTVRINKDYYRFTAKQ